jgi:hypothetical protein
MLAAAPSIASVVHGSVGNPTVLCDLCVIDVYYTTDNATARQWSKVSSRTSECMLARSTGEVQKSRSLICRSD